MEFFFIVDNNKTDYISKMSLISRWTLNNRVYRVIQVIIEQQYRTGFRIYATELQTRFYPRKREWIILRFLISVISWNLQNSAKNYTAAENTRYTVFKV